MFLSRDGVRTPQSASGTVVKLLQPISWQNFMFLFHKWHTDINLVISVQKLIVATVTEEQSFYIV
jgi:hypothetical protein